MPVLVTGVEDDLGATIARTLLAGGGEVRVWLDAERSADAHAQGWRARGAKAAIGVPTDEGRLEAALEQVHTVVHAAGGPLVDAAAGTEHLATVVSAALGAGNRRLVWVTDLLARPPGTSAAGGAYVAALRERAALVDALPLDVVVIRTGLRWGPGDALTRWLAARGAAVGVGAVHAPVWIADVAGTVAAADAQRGSAAAVHLDVELVGPEEVAVDRLAASLADAARVAGAPLPAPTGVDDATLRAWLEAPAVGSAAALGRQGTGLAQGLRAVVAAWAGTRP